MCVHLAFAFQECDMVPFGCCSCLFTEVDEFQHDECSLSLLEAQFNSHAQGQAVQENLTHTSQL